jgi:polyferredoxin
MPITTWTGYWTRRRRLVQVAFLLLFAIVPVFDLFRFDFPGGRLFAFGKQLWLDEWMLLWLALMFGMWVIGAVTLVFGRVWCAWACPQMVFTELAHDVDLVARKVAGGLPATLRRAGIGGAALVMIAILSVVGAALFMGYFAPLPEVLRRLARLDLAPWVGVVGAFTALLGFLDLAFVRERFCRSVCPYGLLQAVLEDGKSLHVAFDTSTGPCIECRACEKICPMEIDIRKGSFQIECTRCGDCIDVCGKVLRPKGRPSLLSFRFGAGAGGWDLKRILVALSTAAFGVAFAIVLLTRETVSLHLSPLFGREQTGGAVVESSFLLRAANRGTDEVRLQVTAEGLPSSAVLDGLGDGIVPAGGEKRFTLVVRLPRGATSGSVTPFTFRLRAGSASEEIPAVFYAGGGKGAS